MNKKAKIGTARKARDLAETRKEILQAAFHEVYCKGFQGASVDRIIAQTRLTKGALYHQFPSKLALGYALVDEVIRPLILERWLIPLRDFENPVVGTLSLLRTLIGEATAEDLRLGCPLNNLVQEMAPVDAGFKMRLEGALREWIDRLAVEFERAKSKGFLSPNVDATVVAYFVVMAHEGFYGMLKGLEDPKAFEALYTSMAGYMRSISRASITGGP